MNFSEFASGIAEIEQETSDAKRRDALAHIIKQLDIDEIAPFIYLCQSRWSEPYFSRKRSATIFTVDDIESQLEKAINYYRQNASRQDWGSKPGPVCRTELCLAYTLLHNAVNDIDYWLNGKRPIPVTLIELAIRSNRDSHRYLARLLLEPLVTDASILEALSAASPDKVVDGLDFLERAYKETLPDLGKLATLFRLNDFHYDVLIDLAPEPGTPIKPQEIWIWSSAEEAYSTYGSCIIQPKRDGWQLQIHKSGNDIRLFSRKLEEWTQYLPDVVQACRQELRTTDVILDSEIVGYDSEANGILPRQMTLHSRDHKVYVFDLMRSDGADCREKEYHARRKELTRILPEGTGGTLVLVEERFARKLDDITRFYTDWSKQRDYEGVIAISYRGKYRANSRTKEKGKIKDYVSLDLAVLGYKPSDNGIASLVVGVWLDELKRELIPIGTAEITIAPTADREKIISECLRLTTRSIPGNVARDYVPQNWIIPELVVEVRTNGMKIPSTRFLRAGFELHRKTKLHIREDIGVEDADFLADFWDFKLPPGY